MSENQSSRSTKANDVSASLYAKRTKIYPREVHGIFAMWRTIGVVVLLGIYYGVPWLQWGGRQAVLFDLPERKFYIFNLTFWPQDFFYLAVLLIIAALSLIFFTTLAGRVWCGYACPQTVWTEAFLWIERKIEGDRMKQIKWDVMPWTGRKIFIKSSKHIIWILFAAFTGFTFVGYFTPITGIIEKISTLSLGPWESFWIVFYSFATYGNAGWLREQVCIYMCPYARFQGTMFDKDTLIISYDEEHGEPRGSRKKNEDPVARGLGRCIDCAMCVQVCPTGIDIRQGLQYQCIACAACIDVCDDVMNKMSYSKGLIRYTTENAMRGNRRHIIRPRVIIYSVLLILVVGSLLYALSVRIPLEMDVIRDRNELYRETMGGLIENVYTLKLLNMDVIEHEYSLKVEGIKDLILEMNKKIIRVPAGEVVELPVWLRVEPDDLQKRSTLITFDICAIDNEKLLVREDARFLGPVRR